MYLGSKVDAHSLYKLHRPSIIKRMTILTPTLYR
jgi:hypothetical protein